MKENNNTFRCADVLLKMLINAGVDVAFGIPGGSLAPAYDALVDHSEIKVVICCHENNAIFSAAVSAQSSGDLGVDVVTSGPGILKPVNATASSSR